LPSGRGEREEKGLTGSMGSVRGPQFLLEAARCRGNVEKEKSKKHTLTKKKSTRSVSNLQNHKKKGPTLGYGKVREERTRHEHGQRRGIFSDRRKRTEYYVPYLRGMKILRRKGHLKK